MKRYEQKGNEPSGTDSDSEFFKWTDVTTEQWLNQSGAGATAVSALWLENIDAVQPLKSINMVHERIGK